MITSIRNRMVQSASIAAKVRASTIDGIHRLLSQDDLDNRYKFVVIHYLMVNQDDKDSMAVLAFRSDEFDEVKRHELLSVFADSVDENAMLKFEDFEKAAVSQGNDSLKAVHYVGVSQVFYMGPKNDSNEYWQITTRFPDDSMVKFNYDGLNGASKVFSTHPLSAHISYKTIPYILNNESAMIALGIREDSPMSVKQLEKIVKAVVIRDENNYQAVRIQELLTGASLDERPDWFQ